MWRVKLWNNGFEKSSYLTDADFAVPSLPDYAEGDKLNQEHEILGVSVKAHPITLYGNSTSGNGVISARDLHKHVGETVKLTGWLVTAKRTRTVHGEYMKFLTMEDETDIFEVTLFPKIYKKYGHLLQSRGPYLVIGKVENDGGSITLTMEKFNALHTYKLERGLRSPTLNTISKLASVLEISPSKLLKKVESKR